MVAFISKQHQRHCINAVQRVGERSREMQVNRKRVGNTTVNNTYNENKYYNPVGVGIKQHALVLANVPQF